MELPSFSEPLFYCAAPGISDEVVLTGDEAHHVTVQRLRVGDAIALFDGNGLLLRGILRAIARHQAHIAIRERMQLPRPTPQLDLYCAVPKGDRQSVLLDMATQLGMARFTPLQLERSVTEPSESARQRWRRICVEACKQSRNIHLPELTAPMNLTTALSALTAERIPIIVAHPGEASAHTPSAGGRLALFVGPEGGFTNEELAQLRAADAQFVNLGSGILRIETAAIVLLATINQRTAR